MKKYLMMGALALTATTAFVSCSNEKDLYDPSMNAQKFIQDYQQAFIQVFGQPAANQTWGFDANASRATRSFGTPEVGDITQPYDEAWVTDYLATAKEPTQANTWHNNDNSTYASNWAVLNAIPYDGSEEDQLRQWFTGDKDHLGWAALVAWALENRPDWIAYQRDQDYVTNFKITGTYDGYINVAASEGIMEGGTLSGAERTVVVTGTWNITEDQRIGSLGKIIIANGGVVNVASGKTLNMVNQARLVVLPGGQLTGNGTVEVNNGNEAGLENYNGGIVDVATFNNNFGKFYNYGEFKVKEYQGGAQESNFYNHHLASIDHFGGTGSTANARIFNECQFYVKGNARIRNYEGIMGSSFIVGGQLMCSSSEDGTTTPTYVGLAAGALVQAGSLYNNGTSWSGPTEGGYAVLNIGQFDYMNWEQDHPERGGYFANNIYLVADNLSNVPKGNGMQQEIDNGTEYYTMSKADWKFENILANAVGNGNVTIAEKGEYEVIPADADFDLGKKGCTPGFKIKKVEPVAEIIRVFGEDLSATEASDFDFNDVVFDAEKVDATHVKITLWAAGGTLPLRIYGNNVEQAFEVHNVLGTGTKCMTNTHAKEVAEWSAQYGNSWKDNCIDGEPFVTTITVDDMSTADYAENFPLAVRNLVKVEVQKGEGEDASWYELTAEKGVPTCKIACKVINTRWMKERKQLVSSYPDFESYVGTGYPTNWWSNVQNETNLYGTSGLSVICDICGLE